MAELVTTYSGKGQINTPHYSDHALGSIGTLAMGGARAVLSGLIILGTENSGIGTALDPFGIAGNLIPSFRGQIDFLEDNVALAETYQTINQQDFTFWASTYQPAMGSALFEGMNRGFYREGGFLPYAGALDYRAAVARSQSNSQAQTDRAWHLSRRKLSKYNVGLGRRADYKFSIARLNAELEGWNLGFRYEDTRKMRYDEERHAHQAEILNLGIGAANAVREGLATSVKALNEVREQRAGERGMWANGLATSLGFDSARQGMQNTPREQYNRGVSTSKNSGISGGIPDVSQQRIDMAAGVA